MKRKMSVLLMGFIVSTSIFTFATGGTEPNLISEPQPELYEQAESVPFELTQDGDDFTIILEENLSTGYGWESVIEDAEHVSATGESTISPKVEMPGAPGEKAFSFHVEGEGISTITFNYVRVWEGTPIKKLKVLVYKKADKVIVEEDQLVYAMDVGEEEMSDSYKLYYNETAIASELEAEKVDGVTMIPLRAVVEGMGFEVTWNAENSSVEIMKGAQWTSLKIGENAYFRNRMAPWALSSAPVIVNGNTYVPVEFVPEILNKGLTVENGDLYFSDYEFAIHEGFVKAIAYDETGMMTITLVSKEGSEDIMDQTLIHTSKAYTHYNKEVVEGAYIKVISPLFMTMSIPGQTSGYVVY